MNLTEEINALPRGNRPASMCSICWTFKDAPEGDRAAVNSALAGGVVINALTDALARNGYDVSSDALRRHNRQGHTL